MNSRADADVDADAIADCVCSTFETLPEKRKPRARNDRAREWVPLAGIVLAKGTYYSQLRTQ
ncbi:hypothetical protein CC78DRAFT_532781 [Lojkania enalia]|uniref:Uncharacterized protein n=1 Tax=Lojkania enalia TaxID=147567 RepID=A0A9P4K963_9PLEO|nr:hypothetical protein CC78DRAFT_532781 [Didymosphaeria enalia]